MDHALLVDALPKILAMIPAGETLIGLRIRDTGCTQVGQSNDVWHAGIIDIEIETFGPILDSAAVARKTYSQWGTKTWQAFRIGEVYAVRLTDWKSNSMPTIHRFGDAIDRSET